MVFLFCRALCGLVLAVAVGTGPAGAAARGSADVQWAQQILKDKHFDAGKPNGEMTAKTHAALSAYQRSVGLPVTGELDPATIAKLMAERSVSPTLGTLGAPGGSPHGHTPAAPPPPPALHGAPASRVDASGSQAAVVPMLGAGRSGGEAPAPQAVPSGTVTAVPTPALPGQTLDGQGSEARDPLIIAAAPWVRTLVIGVIIAVFGGFAALWWLSGRSPSWLRTKPLSHAVTVAPRVEPSFGEAVDGGRGEDGGLRARRPL